MKYLIKFQRIVGIREGKQAEREKNEKDNPCWRSPLALPFIQNQSDFSENFVPRPSKDIFVHFLWLGKK